MDDMSKQVDDNGNPRKSRIVVTYDGIDGYIARDESDLGAFLWTEATESDDERMVVALSVKMMSDEEMDALPEWDGW
jgi:hypothetical protein